MSNAMRSGKRLLAGVAAGALALGTLSFVGASSAQATTYGLSIAFPSMTVVSTAATSQLISITTSTNGVTGAITGTTTTATITNSAGVTWTGTDDTRFASTLVTTDPVNASGVGVITLKTGSTGANFSTIAPGNYTLTATTTLTASGVGIASATMPITVVDASSAGTISGTVVFLSTGDYADAVVSPSALVVGGTAITNQFAVVRNGTGGPIVAPATMYTGSTTPTSNNSGTTAMTETVAAAQPGIVTMAPTTADNWAAAPANGTTTLLFANPVNQVSGTRAITIASSSAISTPAITSPSSAAVVSPVVPGNYQATLRVPATNGVAFTISGVTTVSSTATANVPVTITPGFGSNSGAVSTTPSYSSISPATAVSTVSGSGGAFSQTFTVANPVAGLTARVVVAVPGATATYVVQFSTPQVTAVTASPAVITAQNSGTVTLNAAVTDQFGDAIANNPVQVSVTGVGATTTPAVSNTDSNGRVTYTITVPAGTANGAVSNVLFGAWNGSNYTTVTSTATVNYTSGSASVNAIAVRGSFNGNAVAWSPLTNGSLNGSTNPMYVNTQVNTARAAAVGATDGFTWSINGTATNATSAPVAGAAITITASEGGVIVNPTTGLWANSVTTFTGANGTFTAQLSSTKTGVVTYTIKSGDTTSTVRATYANRVTDARTVALAAQATTVPAGSGTTLTATVSDRFGNPVQGVTVNFTEEGPGYIGGTGQGVTNALGRVEATLVTVPGQKGDAVARATVASTGTALLPNAAVSSVDMVFLSTANATFQVGNAANSVSSYTVAPNAALSTATVAGVPAGVGTAAVDLKIEDVASKTITIVGERTTVSGKSGIKVDGIVEGIEDGKTVKPFIRFPGQTTFTEGTARPEISGGEFTWQRKTGKRVTVYVTSDDGAVTSNRVTIQAS